MLLMYRWSYGRELDIYLLNSFILVKILGTDNSIKQWNLGFLKYQAFSLLKLSN